jgi:mannose-6-phosphate isomerase-like protein (cupin superfamily)
VAVFTKVPVREVGPPLPPATADLVMATDEVLERLTPETFKPVPGFDIRNLEVVGKYANESYQSYPGFPGLDLCELGPLEKLTDGKFGGTLFRRQPGTPWLHTAWHMHQVDFQISYIVRGSLVLEMEGVGPLLLESGAAVYQPGGNRHRTIEMSDDCEAIEMSSPARFRSTVFLWDEATEAYNSIDIDTIDDAEEALR